MARKRIRLQDVKVLEDKLTESIAENASLNLLADLTALAASLDDPHSVLKAIYACYRVFVLLISKGCLSNPTDEQAIIVRTWIFERLDEYVRLLCGLLQDEESCSGCTSALDILMSLLKHLSTSLSRSSPQPQFHVPHFKKRGGKKRSLQGQLPNKLDAEVRDHVSSSSPNTNAHVPENLLSFLERLESFPVAQSELKSFWTPTDSEHDDSGTDDESDSIKDDWRKFFDEVEKPKKASEPSMRLHQMTVHQSLYSLPSHRAVFTRLWLRLLPRLSDNERNGSALSLRALNILHRGVLPHLTRAVMVMDWVGGCVDYGGVVGLLALNALFILMQEYNLDYPSFYTRLYAFLDQDLLHLKYRSRFFRLSELFLSPRQHLPAALLASFVKRLSRLSLTAPPSSIVITIPFVYNILKRHPALMCMIHRDGVTPEPFEDPFLADEPNPNLTNALDSSLWELYSHKNHYHAGVSTLARIFEEAFTKPSYPLEDFLDHTYATQRMKKDPAVELDDLMISSRRTTMCSWTGAQHRRKPLGVLAHQASGSAI
ncbi:CBF/Mak21 family-domain-containing protein [Russula vinacea]|nr:CBF/Mak21 family-domain-containing protein [Russula vinacea]